ncbi:MAG: response regulator [Spirochaetes bacterium]|nr:response regulator [Spirochaetota bacterium]
MSVKIAIIDDEEDIRKLFANVLKDQDYEILQFADAKQLLDYEEKNGINEMVLVVDVMMPGMNGIEMLKLLSKKNALINTPVIYLTAYPNDMEIAESFDFINALAVDYMGKPFNINWLIAKIHNLVKILETHKKITDMSVELVESYNDISNINSELQNMLNDSNENLSDLQSKNDYLLNRIQKLLKKQSNNQMDKDFNLQLNKLKDILSKLLNDDIFSIKVIFFLLQAFYEQKIADWELLEDIPEIGKIFEELLLDLEKVKKLMLNINIIQDNNKSKQQFYKTKLYGKLKEMNETDLIESKVFREIMDF